MSAICVAHNETGKHEHILLKYSPLVIYGSGTFDLSLILPEGFNGHLGSSALV